MGFGELANADVGTGTIPILAGSIRCMDLSQITAVVPTHRYPPELPPLLEKLSAAGMRVLVLDNGPVGAFDWGRLVEDDQIRIITEPRGFNEQRAAVSALVESAYAINVDDDHAISIVALQRAMAQLADSNCVAVSAPVGLVMDRGDGSRAQLKLPPLCDISTQPNFVVDCTERIRAQFHPFRGQAFYSLARREAYSEMMTAVAYTSKNASSAVASEFIAEMVLPAQGFLGAIPNPICFRRDDRHAAPRKGRWLSYDYWATSRRYRTEVHDIADFLASKAILDCVGGSAEITDLLTWAASDVHYRSRVRGFLTPWLPDPWLDFLGQSRRKRVALNMADAYSDSDSLLTEDVLRHNLDRTI